MGYFSIFWILSWLLGSTFGRLVLLVAVLWYLDDRYLGLLANLMIPLGRIQRLSRLRFAVTNNPSDVGSRVELADVCLHAGTPKQAVEYLEQAFARREDSARAIYLLGAALVKLGQFDEGRAKLEEALAKSPEVAFGEPYLYLLEATIAQKGAKAPETDAMVESLRHFDSVEMLTRAGRILGAAGRTDLARPLLEDAVRNYRYTPRAMRRRARRWLVRAQLGLLQYR